MYSTPDPVIEGSDNPLIAIWNNERLKYTICTFGGNRPSHVIRADGLHDSSAPIVYGPASDESCELFLDAQCAKAISNFLAVLNISTVKATVPILTGEPASNPIEQLEKIEALDIAQEYIKTLEQGFESILALDPISMDYGDAESEFIDRDTLCSIIDSVYTRKTVVPSILEKMDRPFDNIELDELMRGPFFDLASEIIFSNDKTTKLTMQEMRLKFRMAMARFRLNIRLEQKPHMLGDDGFPYILFVTAKNNLGKEVMAVACTDPEIADSYREYAMVVHGARDFFIRSIPIDYLPFHAIFNGLKNSLNGEGDADV